VNPEIPKPSIFKWVATDGLHNKRIHQANWPDYLYMFSRCGQVGLARPTGGLVSVQVPAKHVRLFTRPAAKTWLFLNVLKEDEGID
jgi:hypothetical protein